MYGKVNKKQRDSQYTNIRSLFFSAPRGWVAASLLIWDVQMPLLAGTGCSLLNSLCAHDQAQPLGPIVSPYLGDLPLSMHCLAQDVIIPFLRSRTCPAVSASLALPLVENKNKNEYQCISSHFIVFFFLSSSKVFRRILHLGKNQI